MKRREFLTALASSAAGVATGWWLTREPHPGSSATGSQVEVEALRAAAGQPGPAEAKLAALAPLRHKAIPIPEAARLHSGLSADTHRVHYDHHYREYLARWETAEREFLRAVAALSRLFVGGKTAELMGGISQARQLHRDATAAAMMAVMHPIYWQHLGAAPDARTRQSVASLARDLDNKTGGSDWLMVTHRGGTVAIETGMATTIGFAFGDAVLAAIDMAGHAWMLDFATSEEYLAAMLTGLEPAVFDLWSSEPRRGLPARELGESAMTFNQALTSIVTGAFAGDATGPELNRVLEGMALMIGQEGGRLKLPGVAWLPLYDTMELLFTDGFSDPTPTLPNLVN